MPKLKASVLALMLAVPLASVAAPPAQDLRKEVELLKAQLKMLERKIDDQAKALAARPAAPAPVAEAAPAEPQVDLAEFNRIRVKTEGLEDTQEMMGFKGLKISGYIDPTFVVSQRANSNSLIFLGENYSADPSAAVNDFNESTFSYYNSYFGGVGLRVDKEFEGGMTMMATLRPRRNVANTLSFGNLFEEATLAVPLGGLDWKATAGQTITWNGYEYVQSYLKKNISSNLLLDFAGPGYMSGVGVEYKRNKIWVRTSFGNISNNGVNNSRSDGQGAHWRFDYAKGEFMGWGASGLHGKVFNGGYNYLELDGYFTRGPLTLMGQIEGSDWKRNGFNGGDTGHWGVSGLAGYKITPQVEALVRADYFYNKRNGGGTPATNVGSVCPADVSVDPSGATPAEACGDYRNGFGPGAVFDQASGVWALGDVNRGAKRAALTMGLNYQYHTNALFKTELRYDTSDLYSFQSARNGGFYKDAWVFMVQTVLSF